MLDLVLFGPANGSRFLVLDETFMVYMWRDQTFTEASHVEDCLLQIVRLGSKSHSAMSYFSVLWMLKYIDDTLVGQLT